MLRRLALALTALSVASLALAPGAAPAQEPAQESAQESAQAQAPGLRDVMWVGNNWAGTASIVDAHDFTVLKRGVDLIPDKAQELADIRKDLVAQAYFLLIRYGPGEGHDQFVDDMFTTRDGRYLAVSRPSFADVVWIDIAKATAGAPDSIVREQSMDGHRSDHMAVSPDGRRLLVSDSTKRQVIEYSMVDETLPNGSVVRMGDRIRTFASGETPHESNYTRDGERVFHASIGLVYTPGDLPLLDGLKGDRWFQVVRNSDFSVERRWGIGRELAEAGHPAMSSAVRPMAVTPDERYVYFQVSFFHGFVEFDTQAPDLNGRSDYTLGGVPEPAVGAVTRVIPLPNRVPTMPREQYVNDSAHHGLSINAAGDTLCVAGTMDDYAALVDRESGRYQVFDEATTGHTYLKPYWTTEGLDDTCWISLSGSDAVAVIDT
ncbi:MAG TPA: serine/threonine protein kinase, partial [Nocardioides sp.]|nr:serine/threonine protein kinase [Nocardioides sp.]